ncbi:hypothetical protein [Brevibacillus brevis]|uniref:Uncharacterized protein n=1 Tax=Brevibacillus brevis TaxID=1393 RepID=A0ABY9TCU8_BREBE|nr:hypothetical protein [Brevibacillus brevis]WNC17930.1 hypothetical protein RGB73_30205 [Brevibacillus brevis]
MSTEQLKTSLLARLVTVSNEIFELKDAMFRLEEELASDGLTVNNSSLWNRMCGRHNRAVEEKLFLRDMLIGYFGMTYDDLFALVAAGFEE